MRHLQILLLSLFIGSCSSLSGENRIERDVELSDNSPRSGRYLDRLQSHSKMVHYYDSYQFRLGVQGVWLSEALKSEMNRELRELYGPNLPPTVTAAMRDLFPEKNCDMAVLVQAWDDIYRENPFERKPRSIEVTQSGQIPFSIRRLNDLGGIETEFFPFRSFWGNWHRICFVGYAGKKPPVLDFRSPTGKLTVNWRD